MWGTYRLIWGKTRGHFGKPVYIIPRRTQRIVRARSQKEAERKMEIFLTNAEIYGVWKVRKE